MANIANKAFSKITSGEIIKKKKSTYWFSKNCEKVVVSRFNKEISGGAWKLVLWKRGIWRWHKFNKHNEECFCSYAGSAIYTTQDKAVEGKEDSVWTRTDILCLLGDACTWMSNRRRELLRPFLKSDHAGLCDTKVPVTSLLFRSDLSKTLKESREANRLGREQRGKQTRKRSVLQIKKTSKWMGYRSQFVQNKEKQDKQNLKKKQKDA